MKKFIFIGLIIVAAAFVTHAAGMELSNTISVSEDSGCLTVSPGISISLYHVAPGWSSSTHQSSRNVHIKTTGKLDDGLNLSGTWNVGKKAFTLNEYIKRLDDGGLDCSWKVRHTSGIETEYLFLLIKLSPEYAEKSFHIGEDTLVLPPMKGKYQNLDRFRNAKRIEIPIKDGKVVLTGTFSGMVIASKYHPKFGYYGLRIKCRPFRGKIRESEIKLNIKFSKISSFPVSLETGANTSFCDECDSDRKGGWTDQGHEKDMRGLQSGRQQLGGINFDIANTGTQAKKSCIVLRGRGRPYFPLVATVPGIDGNYRRIYLLHATAWGKRFAEPVGKITVVYQDSSRDELPVRSGRDVDDWAFSIAHSNAFPAWTGSTHAFGKISLYLSSFPLRGKPVRSIKLSSSGKGPVWMVAAMSVSPDAVSPLFHEKKDKTLTFQADRDWIAIDWKPLEMKKNSALDFSSPATCPAGRFGEVRIIGDKFCFSQTPERPVRFYGCTMFHKIPFIEKRKAEALADYLAAVGYNVVRFHCFHPWLTKNDGSPEMNPEALDQFCYMLACLRRRGIYYTFPLFGNTGWAKVVIDDPALPEYSGKEVNHELRGLVPISPAAMTFMEKLSANLLLHVNPYTHCAIKDDPALLSVEMLNENALYSIFYHYPEILKIYWRKCREYLKEMNGNTPSEVQVKKYLPQFIIMRQQEGTGKLKKYLQRIGVKKPITDLSVNDSILMALSRKQLDYVDIHSYWDLAEGIPATLQMQNPLRYKWRNQLLAGAGRLFGKPFSQGEYNTVYPSPFWSYMVPSEAAIAGIQGWNMIISCGMNPLPKDIFSPAPAVGIKSFNPLFLLTERIGSFLFKSGAVQSSTIQIPFVVTEDYIRSKADTGGRIKYPDSYADLGLCCQTGTVIYEPGIDLKNYPYVIVPPDMKIPSDIKSDRCLPANSKLTERLTRLIPGLKNNIFRSTNGQTVLNPEKKTFRIMTDNAECFMIPATLANVKGRYVKISENHTLSTFFVGSLDGVKLSESSHLIAMFITELRNTGSVVTYKKNGRAIFKKVGTVPYLLHQGHAVFSIKTSNRSKPRVWALKFDGSRGMELKTFTTADGFRFEAKAVSTKDTYFAYEISWK